MRIPISVKIKTLERIQEFLEYFKGRGWIYASELSHYCVNVAAMRRGEYEHARRLSVIVALVDSEPIPFMGTVRKYRLNESGARFLKDAAELGLFTAYSAARKRLNKGAE